MFHLLGILFIIFIAVLVIGLSIVGSVFRAIFGFGRNRSNATSSRTRHTYSNPSTNTGSNTQTREQAAAANEDASNGASGQGHKKIFTKDEGEYVDFEEVKE